MGFLICTSSTSSWIGWNDYVAIVIGSVMETTCPVDTTSSTWMLSIT
jgi:hypothetical protein